METISHDCRAKPIETFCNIPKLGKHEHTKTLKILSEHQSQFLLNDQPAFHFEQIWGEATTGEIYDKFARPAIADLVRGRSTLLFVTGRKKNHRNDLLFGETKDTGLLPLTINALYNSIGEHRAMKYYFRPLGSNRYRVQTEAQAMFDRHQRDLLPKVSKNVLGNLTQTSILEKSILDQISNVSGIDEDHIYTVFVSAMEINSDNFHSTTIDLLKVFTEGFSRHSFDTPQNCVEIEFDDARKTRRKLFDTNKIPTNESSTRIYTIRLVHGKKTDQIEKIVPIVSQMTFIDLPTGKNSSDLKIIKDFIVPPKRRPAESSNHLRDFLNAFPLQDDQKNFVPIKILLSASASSNDADETLEDIKWLMSLQSKNYLVYLGREENEKEKEEHVTRDLDDHQRLVETPPPRPTVPPSSRSVSKNSIQQVPSSTIFGQSTARSFVQAPSSTSTLTSIESQRSRFTQNPTPFNKTPSRSASLSRTIRATRSEEIFTKTSSPQTTKTISPNVQPSIPPRVPIRSQRTPICKPSSNNVTPIERPIFDSPQQRRPAPTPPIVEQKEDQKPSRTIFTPRRSSTKALPFKQENLLKRSSSADRVGRERWLHHITDASSINNAIKLRTSLPNPLQLVSNHFNAMSKLLSATKYAIEHRDEDKVQLFQGDVMATSKGGVKVVFTSMDQVTHTSLLPRSCDYVLSGKC